MKIRRWIAPLACAGILALFSALFAPSVSAQQAPIILTGAFAHPDALSLDRLRALPVTTETVFFSTGHGPVKGNFTGVLLWTVLQRAGMKLDSKGHNPGLRHYVLVTGRDGYAAAFSLGELDPEFGAEPVIIAYAQDGEPIADGARLIVPGDKGGGRNVAKIATIALRDGS